MNHFSLIVKREYLNKVRNKTFVLMTILGPVFMVGVAALIGYLSQLNNEKIKVISVLDESTALTEVFQNSGHLKFNFIQEKTLDEAKKIVEETNQSGLIHIKNFVRASEIAQNIKFYYLEPPSLSTLSTIESKLEKFLSNMALREEGIDVDKINALAIHVDLVQESFDGEQTSKLDNVFKLIFGGFAGYMLFMFIVIYGNLIMRSVIEEKTSRIIEVIISSVKPLHLMLGKIVGTSLAGVTQFVAWMVFGALLLSLISLIFNVDVTATQWSQQEALSATMSQTHLNTEMRLAIQALQNLPLANLIFAFLLYFIGGYLLYSSIYAAIGAAVDSETDTQQFLLPILTPLIIAIYVGFFTVIEDPHGIVSVVFSHIPLTSPVVMLMRVPFGVPLWEQALSLTVLVGTFLAVVWVAAKIYRVGILMYGKKPSYKDLIKWLKYWTCLIFWVVFTTFSTLLKAFFYTYTP